jgi:hypothetical protein
MEPGTRCPVSLQRSFDEDGRHRFSQTRCCGQRINLECIRLTLLADIYLVWERSENQHILYLERGDMAADCTLFFLPVPHCMLHVGVVNVWRPTALAGIADFF